MDEHILLSAMLANREVYNTVLAADTKYSAQGKLIAEYIGRYYERDSNATSVNKEIIKEQIVQALPTGTTEQLITIVDGLDPTISVGNVQERLVAHRRQQLKDKISNLLAAGVPEPNVIGPLFAEYTQTAIVESDDDTPLFYDTSVTELYGTILADTNRIKVPPAELNDRIGGGVLPGHCIIVFGRVEMGKSLNAINAAASFVLQGKKVLFVENEDTLADTQRRFVQRLLRKPYNVIKNNQGKADKMAKEKGVNRFLLTDKPKSVADIEALVKKVEPDVCIVNQMRNLATGRDVVTELDTIAHGLRRVGKDNSCVMYLITAATEGEKSYDGEVRDKPMLQIGDVYSSRTGIPGAADLLIGWGGSPALRDSCMAYINICKNKIVDSPQYGGFYVHVNPETGVITHDK